MEITYRQEGDYLVPNIDVPPQPSGAVGIWGQMREAYLFKELHGIHAILSVEGELKQHLLDIDKEAEERFHQLIEMAAKAEGVTEKLKAQDQMEWVRRMTSIREQAREIVITEIIRAPMDIF